MVDMIFGILKTLGESVVYKDFVRRVSNEFFDPLKIEKGVKETLSRDLEFATTLFSLAPRSANAVFGVLSGVNTYISNFASEAVFGLLKGVANDFNAVYAAKAVNGFFDQIERLRKEHPKLVAEIAGNKLGEFLDTLDFGKLRKFLEDQAVCTQGTFEVLNEKIFGNPVKVGNLVAAIPPILNAGTTIAHDAIRRLELPSEVLANVLFETINRINVEKMGETVNEFSVLINRVHEGNYILGRGDRKFKEIAEATAEKLISAINMEEFSKAINAILEDISDISDAIANALWKNPMKIMVLAPLVPSIINALIGIASKAVAKFNELPPDLSAQIVSSILKEMDTKKIGEILTEVVKIVNGVLESDPKLISNILNSIIASTDKKELEKFLTNLIKSLVDVILSNPQLLSVLTIPLIQLFGGLVRREG